MTLVFILFLILVVTIIWFTLSLLYKFIGGRVDKIFNFYKTNLKEEKEKETNEQI